MRRRSSADARPASRGKTFSASVLRRPVRLRLASLAYGEASSDCAGKQRPLRKSIVERFAALARRRESIILIVDGPRRPRSL